MRFLRQSGCVCDRDVAECEYLCKWSVELRNMLASLPTVRASDAEFDHELTRLKTSFRDLFEWEELLMIRTRYADYAPHRRLHEAFRRTLVVRERRSELLLCADWLKQRSLSADGFLRNYLRRAMTREPLDAPESIWNASPMRPMTRVRFAVCAFRVSEKEEESE